jgi:hypothetical protein
MIKKSLIAFITLFILYTIFISLRPKLSSSQHQWQDNVIKAQRYIYNNSDTLNNVIIGSSLSCRLIMDSLPSFYNLSFGGQSVFDGLKILKNKNKLPKKVFIETNVVLRGESVDFTNSLFSPLSFLEKYFLSLRADKQPIAISIKYFSALRVRIKNFIKTKIQLFLKTKNINQEITQTKEITNPILKHDELFDKMLNLQIASYSKQPDTNLLNKQLLLLTEYVKYLKTNGVKVFFFEMPVNYNLV